jgi:flagellar basal-body rod protein FlgG
MIDGLYSALSAIRAGESRLASVANNLANVNTPGYQSVRTDLATGPGGQGVVVASTSRDSTSGALFQTGNPLNLAIEGDSYFQVQDAEGQTFFTQSGTFQVDAEGYLVTPEGYRLDPGIQVPAGASTVSISSSGQVSATVGGEQQSLGQLASVRFNNPAGLSAEGSGLFSATAASGNPIVGDFSQPGFGRLTPGALESSNVDIAESTVDLLLTQRFIQFQTGVIRTEDDLLKELINIGRSSE